MVTGLEIAALVLAIFPIVISGLEHYGSGLRSIKEWIKFDAEFTLFMNALCRQQIFFRQNMEILLSSVVESDYDMARMLDDPHDKGWQDLSVETRLRARLSGSQEYECYMAIVWTILQVLEKLQRKLKLTDDAPQSHWSQRTGSGFGRIEFEFQRFTYTLARKRRQRLLGEFEKGNEDMRKLLGNSDELEPLREKRRSTLLKIFERFRLQASSFHRAIIKALRCDCSSPHSVKLLLSWDGKGHSSSSAASDPPESMKLNIYFPLASRTWSSLSTLVRPDDGWCAVEVEMVASKDPGKITPQSIQSDTTSTLLGGSSTSSASLQRSRKVSFPNTSTGGVGRKSSIASTIPRDVVEILDLCAALKQQDVAQQYLGFVRDDDSRRHTIRIAPDGVVSTSQIQQVVRLDTLIDRESTNAARLSRQTRLAIALTMARALLQLHTGPWLNAVWGKRDVYFFQNRDGGVQTGHPLLVSSFGSNEALLRQLPVTMANPARLAEHSSKAALLSLGILILELWFGQTIESHPLRENFLGPNGHENEYTDLNTALKWQDQALEEGGLDLHNPTRRCISCAFGPESQDLHDEKLRQAVYEGVVQPLARLLARYEEE